MNDFYEEAKKKLANGTVSADRKASAMAPAVREALLSFCEQDAEFAQAVAQGGSFKDCMDAVAKGVGVSISDLEAYRKAVQFFFPGAEIRCSMTVDLIGEAGIPSSAPDGAPSPQGEGKKGIILDLEDFL